MRIERKCRIPNEGGELGQRVDAHAKCVEYNRICGERQGKSKMVKGETWEGISHT